MTVDIATKYLGLDLANPLVASSSPLTSKLDTMLQLEEAGAAAVVLPSLFEEAINERAPFSTTVDLLPLSRSISLLSCS